MAGNGLDDGSAGLASAASARMPAPAARIGRLFQRVEVEIHDDAPRDKGLF
jgi:hypothetical protein